MELETHMPIPSKEVLGADCSNNRLHDTLCSCHGPKYEGSAVQLHQRRLLVHVYPVPVLPVLRHRPILLQKICQYRYVIGRHSPSAHIPSADNQCHSHTRNGKRTAQHNLLAILSVLRHWQPRSQAFQASRAMARQ